MLTQQEIQDTLKRVGYQEQDTNVTSVAKRRQSASEYDAKQKEQTEQSKGSIQRYFEGVKERFQQPSSASIGGDKPTPESFTKRKAEFGETIRQTASGEISPLETGVRMVGDAAGFVGDVAGEALSPVLTPAIEKISKTKYGAVAFEKLAEGMESYEAWKGSSGTNERIGEMLESIVNIADIVGAGAATKAVAKKGSQLAVEGAQTFAKGAAKVGEGAAELGAKGADLGRVATKRVFDKTKELPERIQNVRQSFASKRATKEVTEGAEDVVEVGAKKSSSFMDNPMVSGTIDDLKGMVGLPDSTSAADLVHRAIGPRLTKNRNLRRVKHQYELANQTIVENGLAPKNVVQYADDILSTKTNVWAKIEKMLDKGQAAGMRIDLVPIGIKLLKKAEDSALMVTNPKAAKQIVEVAENLVSRGNDVDILTGERIKQLINAELGDAFGDADLSKHIKDAKKIITLEIGEQLDTKLSALPDEFRELKLQYGALSSIEEDVLKRALVFARRNPEGLVDMLTKTEAASDIVFGGIKGKAKAGARLLVGRQIKKANNADELVKRAFEKLSPKAKGAVSPKTTTGGLEKEAKKFKTAEEFVESQGEPLYHGTDRDFDKFRVDVPENFGRYTGDGVYFTTTKRGAEHFAGDSGRVIESFLEPVKKITRSKEIIEARQNRINSALEQMSDVLRKRMTKEMQKAEKDNLINVFLPEGNIDWQPGSEIINRWKELGYDGAILRTQDFDARIGKVVESDINEVVVYNVDRIKTKDQLTEIWKKANKDG